MQTTRPPSLWTVSLPCKNPKPREILFISYSLLFIPNHDRIHATVYLLTCTSKNPPNVGIYLYIYINTIHGVYGIFFWWFFPWHQLFHIGLSHSPLPNWRILTRWTGSDAISSCIYGCLDVLLVLEGWEKCKCCLTKKLPAKISDVIISVVIYAYLYHDIK